MDPNFTHNLINHDASLLPQFKMNVYDPNAPMNAEIDAFMKKPHRKFNSIFEEYIESRKKYDSVKQGQAAAAEAVGGEAGGAAKNQADALQNKINILMKNQEIEMTHCKETAVKMANDLLTIKLAEARYAYEEELEFISKQYEELKEEL